MTYRNLALTVVLTGLLSAPAWADESPAAPAPKIAVPDASALKEAQKLINDIYADDTAKANLPNEKIQLSKKMLQAAIDTKNDVPGKYVLLGMARDLAAAGGDAETAFAAISELEQFKIDSLKMKFEALTSSSKYVRSRDAQALADRVEAVIDESIAADRYDIAKQLADLAANSAKATKDLDAVKAANARKQEVKAVEAAFAGVKSALATLADKPKDPEANLAAGRFYCLMKGQWDKGLPMLALGGNAALKSLAQKELSAPTDADAQAELGDGWWDAAARETASAQAQARQHARQWYEKALPNLAGLEKAKVQKKLAVTPPKLTQKELVLNLGNNVTMKLVAIPAGKFMMGSPADEEGRSSGEGPQHEVTLTKPFYMGIYVVTQEQYKQVMGKNPSDYPGMTRPVDSVSWDDAMDFCKALSKKTGKTVRLPTEAQWEYACRAGTTTPYNTGKTLSTDQANYDDKVVAGEKSQNQRRTTPVGSFKPNAWGLYDMNGNVMQWCSDWADGNYYLNSPQTDPQGPIEGNQRVERGGSWAFGVHFCRCAFRSAFNPEGRHNNVGFRVVVLSGPG